MDKEGHGERTNTRVRFMWLFHTQGISHILHGRVIAGWKNTTLGLGEVLYLFGRMGKEPCGVAQLHVKREF